MVMHHLFVGPKESPLEYRSTHPVDIADLRMENHIINIGVLGCGPIAQFAHFESCQKAQNAVLYAICDHSPHLSSAMADLWKPEKVCANYEEMLEDPNIDAVILAVSDEYHIPLATMAVHAGKHVLVEKPLSHSLEGCFELEQLARKNQVYVQVGHMKRFDPGIQFAKEFISEKLGKMIALKAWYGDNAQRYTATNNLQPIPVKSSDVIQPKTVTKSQLQKYYLLAHGSHLVDTAQFLGGKISAINARFNRQGDIHCWFIEVHFERGALGHLDLTIKHRGDWNEGFQVSGSNGSVIAKTYNPWFHKSSDVQCYLEDEQQFYQPLGADGFTYRRQLENFADVIIHRINNRIACQLNEGIDSVKALIAIQKSLESKN